MLINKVFSGEEMKVLDEAEGRITAVVSNEKKDRDGDVIRAEGWNLNNFMKHPVLLVNHDYYSIRSQIGEWESMEIKGNKMSGVARFYIGKGNADADWAFELAKEKALAFSVGFIPDMEKAAPLNVEDKFGVNGMEFKGQELLEVSAVTIPSNPDALQRIVKTPTLNPVLRELAQERLDDTDFEPESRVSETLIDLIAEKVLEKVSPPETPVETEVEETEVEEVVEDVEQASEPENVQEPYDLYAVAVAAAESALNEIESQEEQS